MANSVFSPPAVGSSGIATANIIDSAVTTAKVAALAITEPKVAPGATLTLATMQASTSGTSIDFTGIPAGTKEIVVMFKGVSLSGASHPIIQLGDSGGVEASGYEGVYAIIVNAGSPAVGATTTGVLINGGSAGRTNSGSVRFVLIDAATFLWSFQGTMADSVTPIATTVAGIKALSAELDRVRITTANGTDTFDAGSVNIAYK